MRTCEGCGREFEPTRRNQRSHKSALCRKNARLRSSVVMRIPRSRLESVKTLLDPSQDRPKKATGRRRTLVTTLSGCRSPSERLNVILGHLWASAEKAAKNGNMSRWAHSASIYNELNEWFAGINTEEDVIEGAQTLTRAKILVGAMNSIPPGTDHLRTMVRWHLSRFGRLIIGKGAPRIKSVKEVLREVADSR